MQCDDQAAGRRPDPVFGSFPFAAAGTAGPPPTVRLRSFPRPARVVGRRSGTAATTVNGTDGYNLNSNVRLLQRNRTER